MSSTKLTVDIDSILRSYRERADQALVKFLPDLDQTGTALESAMHYAALSGGKRVRPVLVYATGSALGADQTLLDGPACAIELVHAYSLVHDDLPAMDNDDLRRGMPTCHIKYGEAMAILAGDALQALAFKTLASSLRNKLSADTILAMIDELGSASGVQGMAAGQAIDLQAVGHEISLRALEKMHQCKTGALISASVLLGAMCSEVHDQQLLYKLRQYGRAVGLSFQIADDILDVVGETAVLGKTSGADIALNKPTFPSILGLDGARGHACLQRDIALNALQGLGPAFDELRALAEFVINRAK